MRVSPESFQQFLFGNIGDRTPVALARGGEHELTIRAVLDLIGADRLAHDLSLAAPLLCSQAP